MFNVNWGPLIHLNTPVRLRKAKRRNWLKALLAPLVQLYQIFLQHRAKVLYRLAFTSQIIYLEKLLNDQFNNGAPAYTGTTPTGIYIEDPTGNLVPHYIWNKAEQRPKTIIYNLWKSTVHYTVGEYCVYNGQVYVAVTSNTNYSPNNVPSKWATHGSPFYLRNIVEYSGQYDFIVKVPLAVGNISTNPLLEAQMKAWINEYRQVPRRYTIVNYTP